MLKVSYTSDNSSAINWKTSISHFHRIPPTKSLVTLSVLKLKLYHTVLQETSSQQSHRQYDIRRHTLMGYSWALTSTILKRKWATAAIWHARFQVFTETCQFYSVFSPTANGRRTSEFCRATSSSGFENRVFDWIDPLSLFCTFSYPTKLPIGHALLDFSCRWRNVLLLCVHGFTHSKSTSQIDVLRYQYHWH